MVDLFKDRRKTPRFSVGKDAFVVFESDTVHIGQIVDISSGGMGIEYMPENGSDQNFSKATIHIKPKIFLNNLPIIVISDIAVENSNPFSFVPMRRRGIRFGDLPDRAQGGLQEYIDGLASA